MNINDVDLHAGWGPNQGPQVLEVTAHTKNSHRLVASVRIEIAVASQVDLNKAYSKSGNTIESEAKDLLARIVADFPL